MKKNRKPWWQYLLAIPIWVMIDVIALAIATRIDTSIQNGSAGHPFPAATLIVFAVFGLLTFVMVLRAIVLCILAIARRKD